MSGVLAALLRGIAFSAFFWGFGWLFRSCDPAVGLYWYGGLGLVLVILGTPKGPRVTNAEHDTNIRIGGMRVTRISRHYTPAEELTPGKGKLLIAGLLMILSSFALWRGAPSQPQLRRVAHDQPSTQNNRARTPATPATQPESSVKAAPTFADAGIRPADLALDAGAQPAVNIALAPMPSKTQALQAMNEVEPLVRKCAKGRDVSGIPFWDIKISGETGRVTHASLNEARSTGFHASNDVQVCMLLALRLAVFPRFSKPEFVLLFPFRFSPREGELNPR